jgi:hypothetical protein
MDAVTGRGTSGQATVEWIGLVLLLALLIGGLLAGLGIAGNLPGGLLARSLAERIVCAANLGDCELGSELDRAYGENVASLLGEHVPLIRYEDGMRALPVDYRRCRSDSCAEGADSGSIWLSQQGEQVTAFTHVVDCRSAAAQLPDRARISEQADCSGQRSGKLYLQYWFYYPGSATAEGSLPKVSEGIRWASAKIGKPSFHRDDWESFQVRIGQDGEVLSRASSHNGHVYSSQGADSLGQATGRLSSSSGPLHRLSRADPSLRLEPGNWGPSTNSLYVSGGSHAGRVWTSESHRRATPGSRLALFSLEQIDDRARYRFAVTPPWLKKLWRDPEATGPD